MSERGPTAEDPSQAYVDFTRDALVLVGWAIIGTVVGYILFRKRDF